MNGLLIAVVAIVAFIVLGALLFLLVEWAAREDDPNPFHH
jgi:hypothetical protein